MKVADAENAGKTVTRTIFTAPNATAMCPAVTGGKATKRPVPVDGQKAFLRKSLVIDGTTI